MDSDEILRLLANIEFFILVASVNLFVVCYQILAKWWTNEFGRHLFAVAAAESLVLDHGVVSIFLGDYPGRLLIQVILYGILSSVMTWRLYLLLKVQVIKRFRTHKASSST